MRPAEAAAPPCDTEWMPALVGRLADSLGWPITWSGVELDVGSEPGSCYAVTDGDAPVGSIAVDAPDDSRLAAAYESACEVAELFAEMLTRTVTASRTVRARTRDVSALIEAVKSVPQTDDLETAVGHLLRMATQVTDLWSAAFFLYDPRCRQLRLRATYQLPAKSVSHAVRAVDASSPDGIAARDGSARLDRFDPAEGQWLPAGMSVGVCVPIVSDGCFLGSLWCYDRRQRALNSWEADVLQSAAVQLGMLLERTLLQQESRRQQLLTSELEVAAQKVPVALVQRPPAEWGLDLAVRAATVTGVGGDFCDVIPLENRRTLIAIGDAVGHSVPAAMLVSVARGALRALVAQTPSARLTTDLLTVGVNRALQTVTQSEQFVTMFLGIVDGQAAKFTYTNGGHPPPLLCRSGEWQPLESHGMFLGVSAETPYSSSTISLASRDALVCFTDGVTETMGSDKTLFRQAGITQIIPAADNATAESIAETIWQRVLAHDPDRTLRDDRTLLVLKYGGWR